MVHASGASIAPTIKTTVTPHTKPTVKITIRPTHLPYYPVKSPRVQFMPDTDASPILEIPPTETKNRAEKMYKRTDIPPHTSVSATPWPRATPLQNKPIPLIHEPFAKSTRAQTVPKGARPTDEYQPATSVPETVTLRLYPQLGHACHGHCHGQNP